MNAPFGLPADYQKMANAVRFLAVDAVEKAKSGHPGMPLGMADVATVLFRDFLKFNPQDPFWFNRDRFVLSAGHGSMLLYALLHLTGYGEMTREEIMAFRQLHSKTPGHPEYGHTLGVEATTGPLGQGFANAVGMAIAEAKLRAEFGPELVHHRTYALVGDGCLMEGLSQEALSLAGHLCLDHLVVLFDDNQVTIDGPTSLSTRDDVAARFHASGWRTLSVDGHDHVQIYGALAEAQQSCLPTLISCRTTIGYGAPKKAGTCGAHGSPLGEEEVAGLREALHWPHAPFTVPQDIMGLWQKVGDRCLQPYQEWMNRISNGHPESRELLRRLEGKLTPEAQHALALIKARWLENPPILASRQVSQTVLEAIAPSMPELMGGSADLTPSNNTRTSSMDVFDSYHRKTGQYIHFGVREHAMVAALNGMSLHQGILPYGGTFLAFSDYCRPAIRLAALMRQPIILVMTHDSIGLGEDGPTHQPIEQLAALRAIPHLLVMRPADAIEALECWEIALHNRQRPILLALSRQNLPPLRRVEEGAKTDIHPEDNLCQWGGYILRDTQEPRHITLLATGSEVSLAVEARKQLAASGIQAAVVSMPCWELFDEQPESYREAVLGPQECPRLAIEAGVRQGWDAYLGSRGDFIGLQDFGASAPAGALFDCFGITVSAVVQKAHHLLARNPQT